jgi:hypothetical protein
MTIEIKHSLNFVTLVDETHPVGIRLLSLPNEMQVAFLRECSRNYLFPLLSQ